MAETLLVGTIVGLAAAFVGRSLWPKRAKGCGGGCSCGKAQGPS